MWTTSTYTALRFSRPHRIMFIWVWGRDSSVDCFTWMIGELYSSRPEKLLKIYLEKIKCSSFLPLNLQNDLLCTQSVNRSVGHKQDWGGGPNGESNIYIYNSHDWGAKAPAPLLPSRFLRLLSQTIDSLTFLLYWSKNIKWPIRFLVRIVGSSV